METKKYCMLSTVEYFYHIFNVKYMKQQGRKIPSVNYSSLIVTIFIKKSSVLNIFIWFLQQSSYQYYNKTQSKIHQYYNEPQSSFIGVSGFFFQQTKPVPKPRYLKSFWLPCQIMKFGKFTY